MKESKRTKFVFAIIAVLVLAGAVLIIRNLKAIGLIEISKSQAKRIAVSELQEKYGGEFEVRSIEKVNEGVGAFRDHVYRMEVYSEQLDETFSAEILRNGSFMGDNYEEYLYRDKVSSEIGSLHPDENGWKIRELEPDYSFYKGQQKSRDFEDYKRDSEKLFLRIETDIDDPGNAKTVESLFEYFDNLQKLGYRIAIHMYYGDNHEIISIWDPDETDTIEDFRTAISNLVDPDGEA